MVSLCNEAAFAGKMPFMFNTFFTAKDGVALCVIIKIIVFHILINIIIGAACPHYVCFP